MSKDLDVKRFERKLEPKHPWFGTREDMSRLVSIAAECYASRRSKYLEANEGEESKSLRELREADIQELDVTITAFDNTGNLSGPADKVIAQMDIRRTQRVVIAGTPVSSTRFGEATELEIELNYRGASMSVASHDQSWLNETFGRLYDEIRRARHPRWATLTTRWLRILVWALSVITALSFGLLVYLALRGQLGGNIPYYIALITAALTSNLLQYLNLNIPLFEVVPEGARPRYGALLRFMCLTAPATLVGGILVNLATD